MKKIFLGSLMATFMLLIAAPASADSVLHIWHCKLNDGKTTEELMAASQAWLKAARTMDGGSDAKVSLGFPIAANAADGVFTFVFSLPDTKTWGVFMNEFGDSVAGEADEAWTEVAACSKSSLVASVAVE